MTDETVLSRSAGLDSQRPAIGGVQRQSVGDLMVMSEADGSIGLGARPEWRWDVALSFAGAQRDYVEQVAEALKTQGVRCFYDADEQIELWGKYLAEELPVIYGEQAAAVVVFVSAEYAARDWTRLERRVALGRAVSERREYVLPARFDDTPLPGLLSDMVTVDLRTRTPQQFAAMIAAKLATLGITGPVLSRDAEGSAGDTESAHPTEAVRAGEIAPQRMGEHAAIRSARVSDEVSLVVTPAEERLALPAVPILIRLLVERDVVSGGFRLGALNRGELGHFRAEVTGIRDQDGHSPVTAAGGWPIPWLDDGSVKARDIPMASSPRLDFARFNLANLREDLEGTKWVNGDHWTFPTLPNVVNVRYSAVRTWQEQDRHYFIVTVRVIRDDPPGFADTAFKIGTEGQQPYCRPYTAESARVARSTTGELLPGPAITDCWRSTNTYTSGDLMRLQNNSMWHPAYASRPPHDRPPASLRVGIVIACDPLPPDSPPTSSIRAAFVAFLSSPEIMDLIAELTSVTGKTWRARDEHPRFNFGAVLATDDENDTPAAWARMLLPLTGISHFGRDARYADLVLYVELDGGIASEVSPVSLAMWHRRFTRAIKMPAALASFLASDLGLDTSSDPPTEIAIWLTAHGSSLSELIDVGGFTVIPGSQFSWFTGLAVADGNGNNDSSLARTWIGEMCDFMHLDGHETALGSLNDSQT
jgi:hypothetical protein